MAAQESDSEEEDFVTYGKPLEPLEEGEPAKKPIPVQQQTVKDEKGRYQRFHGAFTGGFSAGYYNTVGSKEGWTPSTFVSSRQGKADRQSLQKPEDFMDEEDLGEHGIAPNEIMTTDEFASKAKDRIKEKARHLASLTTPIPGATILQDLIAAAKISVGVELLRKMGWKDGQGVGPRTKRKPYKQRPDPEGKVYGCSLPTEGSEGSEDDEYQPENVTFAPKDVIPIDFTIKDNIQGLGYKGLDPLKAFFGSSRESLNVFTDGSEKTNALLGDVRQSKGRKLGITGQAFGVGALEEDDDDIYGTDFLSKYDTVIKDEEPGDGLFGWTAPKEYKKQKALQKEIRYVGKILDGFSLASVSSAPRKIYSPPDLPRDYRPVHYFRPVIAADHENSQALQVMLKSSEKPETDMTQQSRHQMSSSQRRDLLGETALPGPSSVLELLSEKDRERIKDVKQTVELHKAKAKSLAQQALQSRFQSTFVENTQINCQPSEVGLRPPAAPSDFQPFSKNPEKQQRYDDYIGKLQEGKTGALESSSDPGMTEWERRREQDEFMRAAVLYKSSSSTLSCRFTRAKYEDDTEKVEVPRDMENDVDDKAAAVKMKMFGKLTRDKFEWHPDKLLCKRFNIPDPYPGSTIIGLPKVKRDKYSVFNFLTVPETPPSLATEIKREKEPTPSNVNKTKKHSRWDVSADEKKDSISEFLSLARSESDMKNQPEQLQVKGASGTVEQPAIKAEGDSTDQKQDEESEESRPSMDLFKAIFASSSDEKSSSDEESEEEELQVEQPVAKSVKEPDSPDTTIPDEKDSRAAAREPILPVVTPSEQTMEPDSSDEFGPRLPPVLSPDASRMPTTVQLVSSTEVPQKQKRKKNKEKHKTKRDHKHKKEKKKKHKKHKHKSKLKNKKIVENSSSDSADSSGDDSDAEDTIEISPQELLKRLKRLSKSR